MYVSTLEQDHAHSSWPAFHREVAGDREVAWDREKMEGEAILPSQRLLSHWQWLGRWKSPIFLADVL